jgi:hypothetical protein
VEDELGNVVTIGDLVIRRIGRHDRTVCQHKHMEMVEQGEIVLCTDCGKQITAWSALYSMVEGYQTAVQRVRAAREQVAWERKKVVRMLAAKRIEEVWRRKMVPQCPHCGWGILPEDGLGNSSVCRELEAQRRAAPAATE